MELRDIKVRPCLAHPSPLVQLLPTAGGLLPTIDSSLSLSPTTRHTPRCRQVWMLGEDRVRQYRLSSPPRLMWSCMQARLEALGNAHFTHASHDAAGTGDSLILWFASCAPIIYHFQHLMMTSSVLRFTS
jgi:hypothetical protein